MTQPHTRIQLRRDSAADWASANPVLAEGELGYETDTGRAKYGTGSRTWDRLAYDDSSVFDARRYGVHPDETAANNSAGFAAALTDVATEGTDVGGILRIPPGIYEHEGFEIGSQRNVTVFGQGARLRPQGTVPGVKLYGGGHRLHDLFVEPSEGTTAGFELHGNEPGQGGGDHLLEHCWVLGDGPWSADLAGFAIRNNPDHPADGSTAAYWNRLVDCRVLSTGATRIPIGVLLEGAANANVIQGTSIAAETGVLIRNQPGDTTGGLPNSNVLLGSDFEVITDAVVVQTDYAGGSYIVGPTIAFCRFEAIDGYIFRFISNGSGVLLNTVPPFLLSNQYSGAPGLGYIDNPDNLIINALDPQFTPNLGADSMQLYTYNNPLKTWQVQAAQIVGEPVSGGLLVKSARGISRTSTPARNLSGQVVFATQDPYSDVITATDDLVSYWRLGEAVPGTGTAADEMSLNDGTYAASPTGGVTGALIGDSDTAVTFNGTTQWVDVPADSSIDATTAFSIEFWMKAVHPVTDNDYLVQHRSGMAGWEIYVDPNGFLYPFLGDGTDYATGEVLVDVCDGEWHHVVFTRDGNTAWLYIDAGQFDPAMANIAAVGSVSAPSADLGIAARSSLDYPFAGTMDEVAYYTRALTATEVRDHYLAGVHGAHAAFGYLEDDGNYQVVLTPNREETVWAVGKGIGGFTVRSSNADSTATVDWVLIR